MDESLFVGADLIHAAVRNGKEIGKVEGELIVICGNCLLFCFDFQTLGGDLCALANLGQIGVVVIDQGKGCADTHGRAA